MTDITADADTLMRQAPMTVDIYLREGIARIDSVLGLGYAKAHPELLGAFIQACSVDLAGAVQAQATQAVAAARGGKR